MNYTELLKNRRSRYALGKKLENEEEVIERIKTAVRYSPTAFNSQTQRVKILTGNAQDKLWGEIIPTELHKTMQAQGVPESAWENTKKKLEGFQAAFGTVLFYEDQAVVKKLQEDFPLYAEKFPEWSLQSTGISSIDTWLALTELGLGANLQHYNPVIDAAVAKEYDIPGSFKLEGQLVFGSIEDFSIEEKAFISDDERFEAIK